MNGYIAEIDPDGTRFARSDLKKLKAHYRGEELSSRTEANVLLWCLRILDYCKQTSSLYRLVDDHFGRRGGFKSLLAACAPLKLPEAVTDVMELVKILPTLMRQAQETDLPQSPIENSIETLAYRCGMTTAEQRLLLFGITIQENELLESVMDRCFQRVHSGLLFKLLAHVLDVPVKDIQAALGMDSFLNRAGLLRLNARCISGVEKNIEIGTGVAETFEVANGDWNTIVCKTCAPVSASSLCRDDFEHMQGEWDLVLSYLRGSAQARQVGVNVLFYGVPGCGKTQFARALLSASKLQGYELVTHRLDGSSIDSRGRRYRYRQASQYLKSERPSVLVVDEMDGMLNIDPPSRSAYGDDDSLSKAGANALLESNPVPTIWITNDPRQFDPAQLRRFDLVLEFERPSSRKIKQMLELKLKGNGLSDEWLTEISKSRELTPALADTLAKVAKVCKPLDKSDTGLEEVLNIALNQRGIFPKPRKSTNYRIEYCNASMQPKALAMSLTLKEDARCLLHGSTGTGKTAFARCMAEELHLEPRLVRPSDILDPYVGGTERNIANLFESTCSDETLIILDEFESFAVDRKGVQHNWQVSQVNELLGQLEDYEGRVIACTNLVDYIDPAIRRRFQLKVELMPLKEQQREALFREFCKKLRLIDGRGFKPAPLMRGLEGMAYGHMANAFEIAVGITDLSLEGFAALLKQEIEATNGKSSRPIGFMH